MNKFSDRRLQENEIIFREANNDIQEFLTETEGDRIKRIVPFYCECSRMDCKRRIELTPLMYDKLHKNKKQFVVLQGHEIPEIEKIVTTQKNINVVEKYGKLPPATDIRQAIKTIKI